MTHISPKQVTAVTVTYGDRRHLLEPVLRAVISEGVSNIIVVNNGARWDLVGLLNKLNTKIIDIVDMGENTGSAKGFAAGLSHSISCGAKYVWILDDDNRPKEGSLQILLSEYELLNEHYNSDSLAVLSYRPVQQIVLSSGGPLSRVNPRKSSFHGFHIFDVPYKLWRRTFWSTKTKRKFLPKVVQLDAAPYGGLLLSRSIIEKIGFPRTDFVLYEDDTEYTYRITNNGGKIFVITGSVVDDIEVAWNGMQRFNNSFSALLHGSGDFKAYYNMRNCTFLDVHCRPRNYVMFLINKFVYTTILLVVSRATGAQSRCTLLLQAISDGERCIMGEKYGIFLEEK
jgi:GT2 family glycosyltransferase